METIDSHQDIDDTDEHVILDDPSFATKMAYRFLGRAIYRAKLAKIARASYNKAAEEAAIEEEMFELVSFAKGEIPPMHSDAAERVRREELYIQGQARLESTTINNGYGSPKFLGELIMRVDD